MAFFKDLKDSLAAYYCYLKGAGPAPGALERLIEYVADRPELDIQRWSEQAQTIGVPQEVAAFTFAFFAYHGVPMGQVLLSDRLYADLDLNNALPQEWGDEFEENWRFQFGISRSFKPAFRPETIGELLTFLQQDLDDWRAEQKR